MTRSTSEGLGRPSAVAAALAALVSACGGAASSEAGTGNEGAALGPGGSGDPGGSSAEAPAGAADTALPTSEGNDPAPPAEDEAGASAIVARPRLDDPGPSPVVLTGGALRLGSLDGVVGAVFTVNSPLGTTMQLVDRSDRLCVRGELSPVIDGDYPNYWGAEVGLVWATDADGAPLAEGAVDVAGFGFRLSGSLPPLVRFRAGAADEDPYLSQYCVHVPLDSADAVEISLGQLEYECWNGSGAAFPADSGVVLISWQIPANPVTQGPFDFCIEDVHALR